MFLSGSDPDARDKEERQILFACKRRKRKKGTRRGKTEKRNKAEKNCRKYATKMKNEQDNHQLLLIFMLFICIYAKKIVILHPNLKCVNMRVREKDRKR